MASENAPLTDWLRQQIEDEKRRTMQVTTNEDVAFHEGMADAYTLTLRWVTSGV